MTLLTVDELRGFVSSLLGDDELQLLLDAAETEIVRYAGDLDSAEEWFDGGRRQVILSRQADSLTSVVEHSRWDENPITLTTDDYALDPSGVVLYRVGGGTNSRWRWGPGRVVVTYVPVDDLALRKSVQLDLVKLMETYAPGVQSETVGSWTRQLGSNAAWNSDVERAAILARLRSFSSYVVGVAN